MVGTRARRPIPRGRRALTHRAHRFGLPAVDALFAEDPYAGSQTIGAAEPDRREALAGDCLIVL